MSRKKILFGLIGLTLGITIGFFWTKDYNSRNATASAEGTRNGGRAATGGPNQQAMMANVRETLEKANNNPKDFEAQIAAASLYDQIGRTAEAIEFMKRAYEINGPEAAKLNIPAFLGDWFMKQHNYQESEQWFRHALEYEPNDSELLTELGATFVEREPPNIDKGVQYLEAALKSNPKNGHTLMHLTQVYLIKKDAKSAEEWLGRLKQADSKNQNIAQLETQVEALKAGRPVKVPKE